MPVSLQRVVVGIDFGEASVAAARCAATQLAPEAEFALVLVHVLHVGRRRSWAPGPDRPRTSSTPAKKDLGPGRRARPPPVLARWLTRFNSHEDAVAVLFAVIDESAARAARRSRRRAGATAS